MSHGKDNKVIMNGNLKTNAFRGHYPIKPGPGLSCWVLSNHESLLMQRSFEPEEIRARVLHWLLDGPLAKALI